MVRSGTAEGKHLRTTLPAMVASGIAMAAVLLLIIPVGVMLGGAAWSALMGLVLSEDAAQRAGEASPGAV